LVKDNNGLPDEIVDRLDCAPLGEFQKANRVTRAAEHTTSLVLKVEAPTASTPESVELLDGGKVAYPRMLSAIAAARHSIHLEVYAFANAGVGIRFIDALAEAVARRVSVRVVIDGWGSALAGRAVASALRRAGCDVEIHNRLLALLVGRFGRNHRKLLVVDDVVAFLGGLNIDDVNVTDGEQVASADLALEIRGPQSASLGMLVRGETRRLLASSLRIHLCGLGGGWRLRRRYLRAFARARRDIFLAHGYFIPDRGVVRALTSASRRGIQVHLLLAGQANHLLVRAATRSLYRQLLAAGVAIHEWQGSLMHAKVAIVDGEHLLIGSFNLDRLSLANLETLVEVDKLPVVSHAGEWIRRHIAQARSIGVVEASTWQRRWLFDPLGRMVARAAEAIRRVTVRRWRRKASVQDPPQRS
jgi:cardiolipin synthase